MEKKNSKTEYVTSQIVKKKPPKLKLWQNSKTQIVKEKKTKFWQLKTQIWQNSENQIVKKSKTQIVTKLKNPNSNKSPKL